MTAVWASCNECERDLTLTHWAMLSGGIRDALQGWWVHVDADGTVRADIDRDDHDADPYDLRESQAIA